MFKIKNQKSKIKITNQNLKFLNFALSFCILIFGFWISISISFAQHAGRQGQSEKKERKILYYRNPMNPAITSPTFMKDSMGMDYIPVYEDEEGADQGPSREAIVKIKEAQQELIGVETEPAVTRPLMRMIRTVAKIAFDPELYKAQTEFIQANKTKVAASLAQSAEIKERLDELIFAAEFKLKLLGLSDSQIEELRNASVSDRGLLLSDNLSPYAWAYLTIYESDLGAVNIGDDVVLEAIAYPGEKFEGKIIAIDPVLDVNTRSVRARVQVGNPEAKLKPNMYLNAFVHLDLGKQLAVPKEAVLDTGLRKLVYVRLGKGEFKAKEVELGLEAVAVVDGAERKFYPVKIGLEENEVVVTTGNFLIDSQSQLSGGMSALWGGATEIKQEEQPAHRH